MVALILDGRKRHILIRDEEEMNRKSKYEYGIGNVRLQTGRSGTLSIWQ